MPIALDQERTPGLPVLKRRNLGDRYRGGVIKYEQRPVRNDAGEPVLKDNGKPRMELVVHLMTVKATMEAGINGEHSTPERGQIVRVILKGGAFGQWIDAVNALPRAVHVGDIMELTTTHAIRYAGRGGAGELGRIDTQEQLDEYKQSRAWLDRTETLGMRGDLTLRVPEADEASFVIECEAAYHELNRENIEAGAPTSADSDDGDDW